ncbi:hypothetical protein MLD38_009836 [Melastoma candidum]|uniref:Uncharacterized protein n=1 Tax=Melastoma candidum TaxID=119954 RepID=A0ACB9S7C9_9MYRT|nr:hypothetical protein MLD38_009836 [Melastoma candidum]
MSDLELPGLPDLPLLKLPRCEESHAGLGSGTATRIAGADGEFPEVVDDGCRTPTTEDRRITTQPTCPPAPRKAIAKKRRRRTSGVKAASVSLAEIEEFFREMERVVRDRENIRVVAKRDEGLREKPVLLQLR